MNVKLTTVFCLAALAAAVPARADDEEETGAAAAEESSEADSAKEAKPGEKQFTLLPFCRRTSGIAEVLKPGSQEWTAIEEGRFYPLGSTYRTGADSSAEIQFGREVSVELKADSSFGTRAQLIAENVRSITLGSGEIVLKTPRNFPEGMITVAAPGFVVENPAGESRYTYAKNGDGDDATVRCVTGTLGIRGRHFSSSEIGVADVLRIRTSHDLLFTGLYGISGDYPLVLEQGLVKFKDVESGEDKTEEKKLVWKMSPQAAVRIHRLATEVGGPLAVTVMTFDASGRLKNRCAFSEGMSELTTGEQGPVLNEERDELAKKAAAATETTTTEESDGESESSEEKSDGE